MNPIKRRNSNDQEIAISAKIRNYYKYLIPIFTILLIGAIKSDTDGAPTWPGLHISPFNTLIKNNIIYAYFILAASLGYCIAQMRRFSIIFTLPISLIIYIYIFSVVRIYLVDQNLALKMLVSLASVLAFLFLLSSLALKTREMIAIFKEALFVLSAALVALNMIEYLSGGGYATGARFFGIAGHPNFLGVQMAVCCLAGLGYKGRPTVTTKCLKYAVVAGSLLVLLLSGSRTGLVILSIGFSATYALTNPLTKVSASAIIGIIAVSFATMFGFFDGIFDEGVYARNDINTRAGVWRFLWMSVESAPFLGHGELPGPTANSWLRGWATVGILYPLLLLSTIAAFALQVAKSFGSPKIRDVAPLVGIFFGLSVGSILEGYLFDANSFPLHAWYLSLMASSIHLKLSGRNKQPPLPGRNRHLLGEDGWQSRIKTPTRPIS